MNPTLQQFGIDRLSVDERLQLIGDIWDSIAKIEENYSIPGWQLQELERRLAAAQADPDGGIPWEVVKARPADRP